MPYVKRWSPPWTITDGRAGNVRQAVALATALKLGVHRPLVLLPRAPCADSEALGWAAATQYVTSLLPPELSSTAQGLLSAVQWGLGSALGSFCFGAVAAAWGWRAMWLVGAVLGVVGAALMATQKSPGARPAPAEAPLPAPVAV